MKGWFSGIGAVLVVGLAGSCGGTVYVQSGGDGGGRDGTTSCGAAGEPCCYGTACNNGLMCLAGTCNAGGSSDATSCGGMGEPCCEAAACDSGLKCNAGTCGAVTTTDAAIDAGHDAASDALPASTLANGLIGLWNLNETVPGTAPGGADFADSSGKGHPGRMMGGVSFGVPGKIGLAASLNGVGSYIHTTLTSGPQNYTLSAWINLSAYPGWDAYRILSNAGWGKTNGSIDWGIDTAPRLFIINQFGTLACTSSSACQDTYRSVSTTLVPVGTWVHVAVTYDATTLAATLWANGAPVSGVFDLGSHMAVPNATSAYGFNIGAVGNTANDLYWNGKLQQVAIWSRVLTSVEIAQLYNSGSGFALP